MTNVFPIEAFVTESDNQGLFRDQGDLKMTIIKELKVCYDVVLWIGANQAIKSFGRGKLSKQVQFCQFDLDSIGEIPVTIYIYIHLTSQRCFDVWKWCIQSFVCQAYRHGCKHIMQTGSPAWSGAWSLSTCIQLSIWHNLTKCVWFINPYARAVRYLQFPTQLEESKQVSLFGRHDVSRLAACRTTLQFTMMNVV